MIKWYNSSIKGAQVFDTGTYEKQSRKDQKREKDRAELSGRTARSIETVNQLQRERQMHSIPRACNGYSLSSGYADRRDIHPS